MDSFLERVSLAVKDTAPIKIFLSSPSDCMQHRELSRRILAEIERELGELYKIYIQVVDDSVLLPGYGQPQTVIDRQLPEFDIYVGFMWQRYGSVIPGTDQSGTAHEYATAVKRHEESGAPSILFYFDVGAPDSLDAIDLEQLGMVQKFKKDIEVKSLFKSFKTGTELDSFLRHDLSQAVRQCAEDKIGKNTIE